MLCWQYFLAYIFQWTVDKCISDSKSDINKPRSYFSAKALKHNNPFVESIDWMQSIGCNSCKQIHNRISWIQDIV